ncbi:MAG: hypothetical protein QOH46_538, partial [Solirubrobacteraceae bacterium]|nr:hypothetical protein [Solirubrobacteraceae bacterium]
MKVVFQIALGIIAAIGGFLDIGDLVFNTQAGALFGYDLLWAVPVGVLGIGVYAEMSGRVAAVSGRPVFDTIRTRLGLPAGIVALVASLFVNLLTLAAEVGGMAIILQLAFDAPFELFALLSAIGLSIVIWFLPFEGLERIFGYLGLCLFVFVAVALHENPDWGKIAGGFVPEASHSTALYWYFAVGVMSAALMPYEVYFYSSGAVEEEWSPKDIGLNRANAIIGYGLGGTLSIALMIVGGALFLPHGISPEHLGTIALGAQDPLGQI